MKYYSEHPICLVDLGPDRLYQSFPRRPTTGRFLAAQSLPPTIKVSNSEPPEAKGRECTSSSHEPQAWVCAAQ